MKRSLNFKRIPLKRQKNLTHQFLITKLRMKIKLKRRLSPKMRKRRSKKRIPKNKKSKKRKPKN